MDQVRKTYEFTLNFQGEDITVQHSDMETISILLNDPEAAEEYLRISGLINTDNTPFSEVIEDANTRECSAVQAEDQASCSASDSNNTKLWTNKRKMSELDIEATSFFLGQRLKYSKLFDDKKTNKTSLWLKIAKELNNNGYIVGEGKEGAERCRQKFANLQRQYIAHRDHMKTTGERTKDPPAFYDEMHGILGMKDKVNPRYVVDSGHGNFSGHNSEPDSEDSHDTLTEDPINENVLSTEISESTPKLSNSNPRSIKNRFSAIRKTCKPSTDSTVTLTKLLDEQFKADLAQRDQHFKRLDDLLSVQNEQRERMLKQFDELIKIVKNKEKGDATFEM